MTYVNDFDSLEKELDFIFYDSRAQSVGQAEEFADIRNNRNGKALFFTERNSTGIFGIPESVDAGGMLGGGDDTTTFTTAGSYLGDNLDHYRRFPSSEVFKECREEQIKSIHDMRANSLFLMQSQGSVEDMERAMKIWRKPDLGKYAVGERVKKIGSKAMPPLCDIDRDIIQVELKQPTILPPNLSLATHFNVPYGNVFTKEKAQSSEPIMNRKSVHAEQRSSHESIVSMQGFDYFDLHSLASGGLGSSAANHGNSAIALSDLDLKKPGSFGNIQVGQPEYWLNIPPSHQSNNNIQVATQNSPFETAMLRKSHVPFVGYKDSPKKNVPFVGYKDSPKKNVPLFNPNVLNLTEKEREYLLNRQSSNVNSANAQYVAPTSTDDFSRLYNNARQPDIAKDRLIAGTALGNNTNGKNLGRRGNQFEEGFQLPLMDQVYEQHLQRSNLTNSASTANYPDGLLYQTAYADPLLAQNQLQHVNAYSGESSRLENEYHGGVSSYNLGSLYPESSLSSSVLSSQRRNPLRSSANISHFPSLMKIPNVEPSSNPENFIRENNFASTFMEDLGNNMTRNSGNISELLGRIVYLSLDQNGSRFIQHKLKIASVEERNMMFPEIFDHARELMIDVFGNYVIQKFFDFGSKHQRTQLLNQLTGHVLHLSFHMYGCRVVQKALQIVELDQKIRLVSELEGSVLKCICDQNCNHVIQKCIECLPERNIEFIMSSVKRNIRTLAIHPYGCRVVQRVLEFCNDVNTHKKLMDAILDAASVLAVDQFGNYVVQYILQNGKPEERSALIAKFSGQFVNLSLKKFSSNVVEKCLTYGKPAECQVFINEILGSTEENENLQTLVKDPFGNYVVQKILEICDDKNRELILSRIKIHYEELKMFLYGKNIVARVSKLADCKGRGMSNFET